MDYITQMRILMAEIWLLKLKNPDKEMLTKAASLDAAKESSKYPKDLLNSMRYRRGLRKCYSDLTFYLKGLVYDEKNW